MAPLQFPRTEKTPEVLFDTAAGSLEMAGCSIHENAEGFFRPLLARMEESVREPAPRTTVKLTLSYFNSSSSKYILDLLKLLDEVHVSGSGSVRMEWYYDADDLDMKEAGQDYKALLDMPVELVIKPIR